MPREGIIIRYFNCTQNNFPVRYFEIENIDLGNVYLFWFLKAKVFISQRERIRPTAPTSSQLRRCRSLAKSAGKLSEILDWTQAETVGGQPIQPTP